MIDRPEMLTKGPADIAGRKTSLPVVISRNDRTFAAEKEYAAILIGPLLTSY